LKSSRPASCPDRRCAGPGTRAYGENVAVTSPGPSPQTGTGGERRCRHCGSPLRADARADARFCNRACKAAYRRARRHRADAVMIGFAILDGRKTEVSRACPVCGRRFVPGHGHRRDAKYDRPACRTAAWRQRVRQGVTAQRVRGSVNMATTTNGLEPLASGNATGKSERVQESRR
jgi:hypothetical protein